MSTIKDDLSQKKVAAMKQHNKEDERIYGYFLSVAQKVEKDGGGQDDIIKAFKKEEKSIKETLSYCAAGSPKASGLEKELQVLTEYLPKRLAAPEIQNLIALVAAELMKKNIDTSKMKGPLIKEVMKQSHGQADGSEVARLVNKFFTELS